MQLLYSDADYAAIYKQRRTVLHVFYVITGVYMAFCIGWLIFHFTLPYKDPLDMLPRAMVFVASAAYVLFAFPYLTIKYRRVNEYYKLFKQFGESLKMEERNYFYGYQAETVEKNHLDAYSCIFATWNARAHEWMEREIYVDVEKPLPDFERGDLVRYITQSNFLLGYEIIKKQAQDFGDLFGYGQNADTDEETNEDVDDMLRETGENVEGNWQSQEKETDK